jgi:iron complex outermembrane receptor protein
MRKLHSRWLWAALFQAALSVSAVYAQTSSVQTLPETVVTAARIPQDPSLLPQGVVVITAAEIQAAGITLANEAVRWLGGVVGRVATTGGRDQSLDLRGFGETASSNVVFLVDGVRQNEGDSSGVSLSWIPIDSIERIEIVRGNGSVLHGEGATAGVINVITNKGLVEPGGSASLSLGSFATSDARVSLRTVTGPWRYQIYANAFNTDNQRPNYAHQDRNALASATWVEGTSQVSFQVGGQSSQGGLPGGITPADFASNPKKSYKLQDKFQTEKRNLQVSGETSVGVWRVAVDVRHRTDQTDSIFISTSSLFPDYKPSSATDSTRAALRTWTEFSHGPVQQRFLVGVDTEHWSQDRDHGTAKVNQHSDALYVRHEMGLKELGLKIYSGARQTSANRDISGGTTGQLNALNTSWDIGAAVRAGTNAELFSRLGTSFRLANADEFGCQPYDGGPACPAVTLLKPQTSKDLELGYRYNSGSSKWSLRYYLSDLIKEIGLDPATYSNVNFDPTRRSGVEIDASAKLTKAVDAGIQYAYRQAVFRSGSYAGKTVPMVPAQSLTARLSYLLSDTRTVSLASQLVSSQYVTDDFSNSCSIKTPGYGTLNVRYSERVQAWTLSAILNNLTDQQYYNYRSRCNSSSKSIYPEAGRTFHLTAQRRF